MGTADPEICGRCLIDPPEFRSLRAAASYRSTARTLLLALKFRGADYLAPHLAKLLASRLSFDRSIKEVTAVPGLRRERLRRDHAAELLGKWVAREIGVPFHLRRIEKLRPTRRQSGLPLDERANNVRGAFRARPGAPRGVLLVDDVATSAATARACARALRRAGAETVEVWCFARAAREDELFREPSAAENDSERDPPAAPKP